MEGEGEEGESPHVLSALSDQRAVRSRGPAPPQQTRLAADGLDVT